MTKKRGKHSRKNNKVKKSKKIHNSLYRADSDSSTNNRRKHSTKRKNKQIDMRLKALTGFIPHTATSKLVVDIHKPSIVMSQIAHHKMYYWVQKCSKEVGWFGTVKRLADNVFYIKDVYMFKQRVTAVETEIDQSGIVEFGKDIMTKYKDDPAKATEIMTEFRLWGHSHVHMGTTGSGTDAATIESFRPKLGDDGDIDWFIRLIANKLGRMEWNIYFFKEGYTVYDVPWSLAHNIDSDFAEGLDAELEEKVSEGYGSAYSRDYSNRGYYQTRSNWSLGHRSIGVTYEDNTEPTKAKAKDTASKPKELATGKLNFIEDDDDPHLHMEDFQSWPGM